MNIDSEVEVELEEVEEESEQEQEDEQEEEVVEKQQESLEDKKARLERQLSQTNKKLGVDKEKPKATQSDEFDYGEYAYLSQKGIESDDDIKFVKDSMKDSGKSLRDTLNASWFKAELAERQALASTADATPNGSSSKGTAIDSVEYWQGKDDAEIQKNAPKGMLLKVVNARLAEEANSGKFYNS